MVEGGLPPSPQADDAAADEELTEDDVSTKEPPSNSDEQETGFNRRALALIVIATVSILGLIALAGYQMNWFAHTVGEPPSGEASPTEPVAQLADSEVDSGPNEEQDSPDADNFAGEGADTEEAAVAPSPTPPRQVDPVWNDVTPHDWSTKVLRYFYPYVRRANRADLLQAARQGDSNAQTLAAIGYHTGTIGSVDHGLEVRDFLRPACSSGQGRACTLLAVHYRAGWGVSRSNANAATFYGRGCQLGNQMGCHYEAMRYYQGEGVTQDVPRALRTFTRTCDLGVGYSCWILAMAHAQGAGVEQNMTLARQYYERSRELETPDQSPPFDEVFRPVPAQ